MEMENIPDGMKRSTEWALYYLFFAVVNVAGYTMASIWHVSYGSSIYCLTMGSLTTLAWLGYMAYWWRSDLVGFAKRLVISLPFALAFAGFVVLLTNTTAYAVSGLTVYFFLLYRTPRWKQHLCLTLSCACLLAVALRVLPFLDASIPDSLFAFRGLLQIIAIVYVGYSYGVYLRTVEAGEAVNLKAIFVRILKFTVAFSIYVTAYEVCWAACRRYGYGMSVSLTALSALSAAFAGIIYRLDLMPVARKKKRGPLGKLQYELNEFYSEARNRPNGHAATWEGQPPICEAPSGRSGHRRIEEAK